jgi:hypothetical protein
MSGGWDCSLPLGIIVWLVSGDSNILRVPRGPEDLRVRGRVFLVRRSLKQSEMAKVDAVYLFFCQHSAFSNESPVILKPFGNFALRSSAERA